MPLGVNSVPSFNPMSTILSNFICQRLKKVFKIERRSCPLIIIIMHFFCCLWGLFHILALPGPICNTIHVWHVTVMGDFPSELFDHNTQHTKIITLSNRGLEIGQNFILSRLDIIHGTHYIGKLVTIFRDPVIVPNIPLECHKIRPDFFLLFF